MTELFRIHVLKDEITPFVKKFEKQLPTEMESLSRDVAEDATRRLRMEVLRQMLIWRGTLLHGIQTRRLSRFNYATMVPLHGLMLDSMVPHYVNLSRGRLITDWARTSQHSPWRGSLPRNLPKSIYVKPHPWINRPLGQTKRQIPFFIKRRLGRLMAK
jgi:hypothetical protein